MTMKNGGSPLILGDVGSILFLELLPFFWSCFTATPFQGGEDVHFVHGNSLGIADGVGQWSMGGANASSYARELLENCVEILSSSKSNPMTDLVEVIVRGAGETHSSGLSTVMTASFDGQVLRVVGIGDSGFIIIRNGNVLENSAPMLHELISHCRYTKASIPRSLSRYTLSDWMRMNVIVLATNGVFDNLYEREISLIEIARLLAESAGEVGISKSCRSPFADAPMWQAVSVTDDVTGVVSLVERNLDSRS